MRETKCYCDMCGKEIEGTVRVAKAKFIPIRLSISKHGEYEYKTKSMIVMDDDGNCMDFCEDCKRTIFSSFETRNERSERKEK